MCWRLQPPQAPLRPSGPKCGQGGATLSAAGSFTAASVPRDLPARDGNRLARQRERDVDRPGFRLRDAVALRAERPDPDRFRIHAFTPPSRNSSLPSPPAIGEGMVPRLRQPGSASSQAERSAAISRAPGRVPEKPALADCLAPRLELRLDEQHRKGARSGERERRRQGEPQRNEADVADDGADRGAAEVIRRQVAGVEAFQIGDTRIRGEVGVKLSVADIDAMHMRGAALEQHLRETARRGADVERSRPAGSKRKPSSAAISFSAARGHVVPGRVGDLDPGRGRHQRSGLVEGQAVYLHRAPQDGVAGARARGEGAAPQQQQIEPQPLAGAG